MNDMQFHLRTLHLLVLAGGISLGIFLPARNCYLHWKTVSAIHNEVELSLNAASAIAAIEPQRAIQDVLLLRELIVSSPVLKEHERKAFLERADLQLIRLRQNQNAYERKWAAIDTSCAVHGP